MPKINVFVNVSLKTLVSSMLMASSEYAFANRTFQCDLSEETRLILKSRTPDIFPDSYQTIVVQKIQNHEVVDSQTYYLEKLHGDHKAGVFRFFIEVVGEIQPTPRYGMLAWNPGADLLYFDGTNTRFGFALAGVARCRSIPN